jgi:hypothetical protein
VIDDTFLDAFELVLDRTLDLPPDAKVLFLSRTGAALLTGLNTADEPFGWYVEDNEDGTIDVRAAEGAAKDGNTFNRALLPQILSVAYYRGEGEAPVRYGNHDRMPWIQGSSKIFRVKALSPVGTYTPPSAGSLLAESGSPLLLESGEEMELEAA